MWSAEAVFVCALSVLGRSEHAFPRVEFIERRPPGVSASVQAYVLAPEARIVLFTSTEAFINARHARTPCGDDAAIREISGVLAHEEWHVLHGADEEEAYNAQLIALLAAGAKPDGALYHKVFQAKQAVLAAARRNARAPLMARDGR